VERVAPAVTTVPRLLSGGAAETAAGGCRWLSAVPLGGSAVRSVQSAAMRGGEFPTRRRTRPRTRRPESVRSTVCAPGRTGRRRAASCATAFHRSSGGPSRVPQWDARQAHGRRGRGPSTGSVPAHRCLRGRGCQGGDERRVVPCSPAPSAAAGSLVGHGGRDCSTGRPREDQAEGAPCASSPAMRSFVASSAGFPCVVYGAAVCAAVLPGCGVCRAVGNRYFERGEVEESPRRSRAGGVDPGRWPPSRVVRRCAGCLCSWRRLCAVVAAVVGDAWCGESKSIPGRRVARAGCRCGGSARRGAGRRSPVPARSK